MRAKIQFTTELMDFIYGTKFRWFFVICILYNCIMYNVKLYTVELYTVELYTV